MDLTIPTALETLSTSGAAARSITAWWRKSKGDARALVGELKDNLLYLDMVAADGVPLAEVVGKLAVAEYRRLSREGYNFNKLKRSRIADYPSLRGTELAAWSGKDTEALIEAIYGKLNELVIKFPHVGNRESYRWGVRVNNIRKRIWLLLRHVGS